MRLEEKLTRRGLSCPKCKSPIEPFVCDESPFRKNTTHISTTDYSMLLICTKHKTHCISRKYAYSIGLIRRRK